MSVESSEQTSQPESGDKAAMLQYLALQAKALELQEKKIDYQLKELTHEAEYDKEQLRSDHHIALRDMDVNQEKNRNEHQFKTMALKYGAFVAVLLIVSILIGFIVLVIYSTNNGNSKIIESLFDGIKEGLRYAVAALLGASGVKVWERIKSPKSVKKKEDVEVEEID